MSNLTQKEKDYIKKKITNTYMTTPEKKDTSEKTIYEFSKEFFWPADPGESESLRKPKNSWNLITWIICHSSLNPTAKIVAARIASYYNPRTRNIYPTMETLAKATGFNKATIQRAVHLMEASGEWEIQKLSKPKSQKTVFFYIPLAPLPDDEMEDKGYQWVSSHRSDEYKNIKSKKHALMKSQQKRYQDQLDDRNDKVELFNPSMKEEDKATSLRNLKKAAEPPFDDNYYEPVDSFDASSIQDPYEDFEPYNFTDEDKEQGK